MKEALCKEWTEHERSRAELSPWANSPEELQQSIDNIHEPGSEMSYIHFSLESLNGDTLHVDDSEGELLALAITNAPEVLGAELHSLEDKLRAIFFNQNMDDDSC
ncbi:hypothetical protein DXG03_009584 [Asterophora parasitica]|uniref:Uncharacterized protein n=1 Tax=Asterophora parasitica TaxID=117018 RepID=A0A9P7G3U1_9AGAR|nr:hypothetical protein DXG03_009584 [Asterophora parasitica]